MPLTDKEREAVTSVAKRFYDHKEFTTHQQLLRELKDPSLIGRLNNVQVWTVNTTVYPPTYCPTVLTFHHCSHPELLRFAKRSVEVVVNQLKTIFEKDYDGRTNHVVSDFLVQLRDSGYSSDLEQITFGLFLTKDIPSTISPALNDAKTAVVSFQINDYILNQDPEKVWDNYVQTYDRIAQEDRQKEDVEQHYQEALQALSEVQNHKRAADKHEKRQSVVSDLRKSIRTDQTRFRTAFNTYKIVTPSIGTGGAGTVHLVEDIDGEKYALKVLHSQAGTTKTKRFQNEIGFCSKNDHANIIRILDHGNLLGLVRDSPHATP